MSVTGQQQFNPSRAIILAELSTRQKEKYYQLLLSNNVKYHRDSEGRYVASVRMLAPGLRKEAETKKIAPLTSSCTISFDNRLNRLQQQIPVSIRILGVESFDYGPYARYTALISENGDVVRPKIQSLSWLMKKIELLYDARFAHEKMDVERDDELSATDKLVKLFPVFVVKHLSTVVGLLKGLVDQTGWDLLLNVDIYRQEYLEVEIFARFLQEFYDNDDLLFYLYVRSVSSGFKTIFNKLNCILVGLLTQSCF